MASSHPPIVHRSVHYGAAAGLVGAVQFLIVWIVAQSYSSGSTALHGPISYLGRSDGGSPEYWLFNASLIAIGLLTIASVLLIWGAFPQGRGRVAGFSLLFVASLGAIVAGLLPANVNGMAHGAGAYAIYLAGGLGTLVLGASMAGRTHWAGYRWFSMAMGAIMLVGTATLYLEGRYASAGAAGLAEVVVIGAYLLWMLVVMGRLGSLPARAGRHLVPGV